MKDYSDALFSSRLSMEDRVMVHKIGTSASETLKGTGDEDRLEGRGGNDRLFGFDDQDRLQGGDGKDFLYGGGSADRLQGGAGIDFLYGAGGADRLEGDRGNDFLYGSDGTDELRGGQGNDRLSGGDGADKLRGDIGRDKLYGGDGADRFIFKTVAESTVGFSGRDTIYDFSLDGGDKINVSSIDANSESSGNQAFKFINDADFHEKAGELRYEIRSDDTFVYADRNGDGKADFSVRLDDELHLEKGDFIL
ncbi:Ca2+-binding RTX toxin-like protein [Rhizobium azooxidifex]|uniref:Ca2+-binding RTX toxin-like protein n=1 Tax=Mycoplana azooxidifex TaxID=1636188 RepID=A0A7W6DH35_9HYPH|nr:calcium-binding protein [Mycoplana azooxidifex]MBB3978899.1 Ca2+-binding RTX toxin-like protein [Mycoplana azooxidifex]